MNSVPGIEEVNMFTAGGEVSQLAKRGNFLLVLRRTLYIGTQYFAILSSKSK